MQAHRVRYLALVTALSIFTFVEGARASDAPLPEYKTVHNFGLDGDPLANPIGSPLNFYYGTIAGATAVSNGHTSYVIGIPTQQYQPFSYQANNYPIFPNSTSTPSDLAQDTAGNLYGGVANGGVNGGGIVLKFSPNGDGINDYFVIKGADQYDVTLMIFDRWGSKVYESSHYKNDWNGTSKSGEKLPDGTYYYIVNLGPNAKSLVGYIMIHR